MTKPLRIEYPNAGYYVMNRGTNRQIIFNNNYFFQLFLNLLSDAHQRYRLETPAYCLMNNHYHLLIRTPEPNLSEAMRDINGIYTRKAIYYLEETAQYLVTPRFELIRAIH